MGSVLIEWPLTLDISKLYIVTYSYLRVPVLHLRATYFDSEWFNFLNLLIIYPFVNAGLLV